MPRWVGRRDTYHDRTILLLFLFLFLLLLVLLVAAAHLTEEGIRS